MYAAPDDDAYIFSAAHRRRQQQQQKWQQRRQAGRQAGSDTYTGKGGKEMNLPDQVELGKYKRWWRRDEWQAGSRHKCVLCYFRGNRLRSQCSTPVLCATPHSWCVLYLDIFYIFLFISPLPLLTHRTLGTFISPIDNNDDDNEQPAWIYPTTAHNQQPTSSFFIYFFVCC